MRKFITVLLCVGVLISWHLCQNGFVSAQENMEKHNGKAFECSIAGTWRLSQNSIATIIPLDPTGRRFAILSDNPLPEDPTLSDVFSDATALTPTRGEIVKVSQNLYKYTVIQIAVDEDGNKLGELEASGETKFIDCDNRVSVFTFRFLDADGEQLFGFCGSRTNFNERIKIVPPCDDLPPFPENSD